MEVKYLLEDGTVLTVPGRTDNSFWIAMRNSSKFESELTSEQYRLNFIGRLETSRGIKWHENWKGDDIEHLTWLGFIKWEVE